MKHLVNITVLLASAAIAFGAGPKAENSGRTGQPLTYQNVVAHFKAAGLRRTEVQKRCTIFFEGEWRHQTIYDYCLIIVENSDEDVQVTFYLTDAHEMNWITEFVDAPFFTNPETQRLLSMVNRHAPNEVTKLSHYRAEFHHWEPKHAHIFVFSFTPTARN